MKILNILAVLSILIIGPAHARQGRDEWIAKAKLGSKGSATLLMCGNIPERWQNRAGPGPVPKTLVWPIIGRRLGRGFGSDEGRHLAIDITTPEGTPVRVAARGLVVYAANTVNGYGKMMLVLHPGGYVTLYAHLSEYMAEPGEWVTRGQVIANTGNTGISRGPHLHFALFFHGTPMDPMPLMESVPRRSISNSPPRRAVEPIAE